MHLSSQLVERNQNEFLTCESMVVINPPAQDSLNYLNPKAVVTHDYRVYQSLLPALDDRVHFGLDLADSGSHDLALVFVPKAKGELKLLLSYASSLLKPGASMLLVGEKKQGVASAAKILTSFGEKAYKVDSAKHCQLWSIDVTSPEPAFDLEKWLGSYIANIAGTRVKLATMPGVFSHDRLDEGSELLLSSLTDSSFKLVRGRTLDFGCGSGPIGLVAKLAQPEIKLEMVDINWLALECAKRSAEYNGVEASIYPSDGWSDVTGRFDTVLSNPPFHSGVATEYQTSEHFILKAYDHMTKHAALMLVANNFLKYGSIIEGRFGRCDVLIETSRFRVYKTHR